MSEEVLKKIKETRWHQKFELLPGIITDGAYGVNVEAFMELFKGPDDLSGLKVLDIGTLDGAVAFEFERRGAKTYATDILSLNETGFAVAKEILNSKVEFKQDTVYNVSKNYEKEFFDIVAFKGVYYHLKHPLLALDEIWDILKPGGIMLIGGELLVSYAETFDGTVIDPETVKPIAESEIPLTVCYNGDVNGPSLNTWFVPNFACMRSWLETSSFELIDYKILSDLKAKPRPGQRFLGKAKKVDRRYDKEGLLIRK